jgi:hypothetical protein
LADRFFAGYIQDLAPGGSDAVQGLEHQGGFADAGVAADENQGPGHQSTAQHPVEFGDAGGLALLVDELHGVDGHRAIALGRHGWFAGFHRTPNLFGETVPGAAFGAAAHPFGGFVAAGLADEKGFCGFTWHRR